MGKILFLMLWCSLAWTRDHLQIEALGASPKGQMIAVEEHGFDSFDRTYYSRIRFINVWKKKAHQQVIEIRRKLADQKDIHVLRQEAKIKAQPLFEKYQIIF